MREGGGGGGGEKGEGNRRRRRRREERRERLSGELLPENIGNSYCVVLSVSVDKHCSL